MPPAAGIAPRQPPKAASKASKAKSTVTAATTPASTLKDSSEAHLCFTKSEKRWIAKHNLRVPTNKQIRDSTITNKYYAPALLLMANQNVKGDLKFWEPAFRIFDLEFDVDEALKEEADPEHDEYQSWAFDFLFKDLNPEKQTLGAELWLVIHKNPPPSYNQSTTRYHPREGYLFGREAEWVGDQLLNKIHRLQFNNARNHAFDDEKESTPLQYYTPYLLVKANLGGSAVINRHWLDLLALLLGREDASRLLKCLKFKVQYDHKGEETEGQAIMDAFSKLKKPQFLELPQFSRDKAKAGEVHPIPDQEDLPSQDESTETKEDTPSGDGGNGAEDSESEDGGAEDQDLDSQDGGAENENSDTGDGGAENENSDTGDGGAENEDSDPSDSDNGEDEKEDDEGGQEADPDGDNDGGQKASDRKPECLTLRSDDFELPYPLQPRFDTQKSKDDMLSFMVPIPTTFKEKMDKETKGELSEAFQELAKLTKKGTTNNIHDVKVKDRAIYIGNKYSTEACNTTLRYARKIHEHYKNLISGRRHHCKDLRMALTGRKKNDPDGKFFKERILDILDRAHNIARAQEWAAQRQSYVGANRPIPEEYRIPKDNLDSPPEKTKAKLSSSVRELLGSTQPNATAQTPKTPVHQGQGPLQTLNTATRPTTARSLLKPSPRIPAAGLPGPSTQHNQAQGFHGFLGRQGQTPMTQAQSPTLLTSHGYVQPQDFQSHGAPQNHRSPFFALDHMQNQDPRQMLQVIQGQQGAYNQYDPQIQHHTGPHVPQGQHGGSYNRPQDGRLFDGNAMAINALQGQGFDPGYQHDWTDMFESDQTLGQGQGTVPNNPFPAQFNGQGRVPHAQSDSHGQFNLVWTQQDGPAPLFDSENHEVQPTASNLGPALDTALLSTPEDRISRLQKLRRDPPPRENQRKRKAESPRPGGRDQGSKKPRLDVHDQGSEERRLDGRAQHERDLKFIKEYREEMANSDTKVKSTWSNTLHEGLGVAQGDFTSTATLDFVKSKAMTGDQRKILAQIQQSCNKYDDVESMKLYLQNLVTAAFRTPNPGSQITYKLNRSRWVVTGSIGVYKDRELSMAHALTIVYRKHGQAAMNEAARAFALFEIWAPDCSEKEVGGLKTYPIDHYSLKGGQIATAMWPETVKDKASHVRRAQPSDEELANKSDAEVSKSWGPVHMDMVAKVMQKERMPGEYPAVTTRHDDTTQELDKVDKMLTGEFFSDTIVPALKSVWPGELIDVEALWDAVMTDGQARKNPWSKKREQGSTLGATPRSKQVKHVKVEEEDEESAENEEDEEQEKPPAKPKKTGKTVKTESTEKPKKPKTGRKNTSATPSTPTKSKVDHKKTSTETSTPVKTKVEGEAQRDFLERLEKNGPAKPVAELQKWLKNPKLPEGADKIIKRIIKEKQKKEAENAADLADEFGI
ncbi:hypothetical protein KCU91_g651, partial [Aureobasidium melanogenum]